MALSAATKAATTTATPTTNARIICRAFRAPPGREKFQKKRPGFWRKCHNNLRVPRTTPSPRGAPIRSSRASSLTGAASGMVRPMPALARIAARFAPATAATVILLSPAIWNRFALLEWDTGGYLARWFEGTLVPSRSTTYGLFLAASAPLQFWPALVLQAAAAVWIVALTLRVHDFPAQRFALPVIIAALSAVTALPWLASVLLTDIFAGLAVLALHILVCLPDRVSSRERLGLVLFIGFAGSTHSATYAVLLGLILVALVLSWRWPTLVPRTTLPHGVIAVVLGAVFLLAGNYIVAKRIAWTPG